MEESQLEGEKLFMILTRHPLIEPVTSFSLLDKVTFRTDLNTRDLTLTLS